MLGFLINQGYITYKFRSQKINTQRSLECVGVPAHATPEGKLLASRGMFDVKRTLGAFEGNSFRSHRTLGQLRLRNVGDTLEVIVTRITKVSRPEAEENGHGAAVATLVLQVVCAVFGTHLGLKIEMSNSFFLTI